MRGIEVFQGFEGSLKNDTRGSRTIHVKSEEHSSSPSFISDDIWKRLIIVTRFSLKVLVFVEQDFPKTAEEYRLGRPSQIQPAATSIHSISYDCEYLLPSAEAEGRGLHPFIPSHQFR